MLQCRYSVAQAIQRNWQAYLCILNKQQFFGIFRKGHYSSIFKELSTRMVQQMVFEYNSVILVKNSYDESWDSSCEKY